MKTPAEGYELSSRQLPASLADHAYPEGFDALNVRLDGSRKWDGAMVFVGEAYAGEVVHEGSRRRADKQLDL